mgnify:FL=1
MFILIFTCLQTLQANQKLTERDEQNIKNIEKELNFIERKQYELNKQKELERAKKLHKSETTQKKRTKN